MNITVHILQTIIFYISRICIDCDHSRLITLNATFVCSRYEIIYKTTMSLPPYPVTPSSIMSSEKNVYHIEAEKKLTPFCRRHFQSIFLNGNVWISQMIPLKICFQGFHQKYSIIGSDNGLATNHYLNNVGLFYWRIYASLSLNELYLSLNIDLRMPYINI